jgi:hypothetical protein
MVSGSDRGNDLLKVVVRVAGLILGHSWLRLDHYCFRTLSGDRICCVTTQYSKVILIA